MTAQTTVDRLLKESAEHFAKGQQLYLQALRIASLEAASPAEQAAVKNVLKNTTFRLKLELPGGEA